ncbi:MAG: O-antigen ligase family protein [Dehalococcoidales bacterium]|jgi:O-antigen ligase
MDRSDKILKEEERPLVELPALIKGFIIVFSFLMGLSLLFLPPYLVLLLYIGICLFVAMFLDLFVAVIIFLLGAYLHPTALFPALQQLHIARNLAFFVLLIWILHIIVYKDFKITRTLQNVFVLGLAVTLLISCFRHFEYSFQDYLELASKAVILYLIIANIVKTKKQILILIGILIVSGVISSGAAFFQYIHGIGLTLIGSVVRVFGTTQNPNILAAELVLVVPIAITLVINVKRVFAKFILSLCLGALLMAIVLTFSRAGMATLCIVLFLSFLQIILRGKHKVSTLLLLFVIFALISVAVLPFVPNEYWERMGTITDTKEISIASRLDAWKLALDMIREHPFTGVGYGLFKYEFMTAAITSADITTKFVLYHAHNLYLHTGAEAGILAALLVLAIIIYAWVQLRRAKRNFEQNGEMLLSGISGALEISLTAFFLMNMVSWHLDLMIFWIIIGLSVVLNNLPESKIAENSVKK